MPPYRLTLSNCCSASVTTRGSATNYYTCDQCGEPCDGVVVDEVAPLLVRIAELEAKCEGGKR